MLTLSRSTSGLRQSSGGSASSSRSSSLAGVSTSRPASPSIVVASCTYMLPHHTRRDPTPRVLRQQLFLSPASKLDACGPHGLSRPSTPLPPRQHVSTSAHSTCTTWPCPVATLHLAVHALHRLLSPTRHGLALLLSCAFSSVRDGSLLTSRTS